MTTFTWQVFATFAAAFGAVVVGFRQVGIADGQKNIADKQADTAKAALKIAEAQALTARMAQRANLFDRRYEVYETVQKYLHTALKGKEEALYALDDEISKALNKAIFLFPKRVRKAFIDALEVADECAQTMADRRAGSTLPPDDAKHLRELRKKLRDILSSLSDTMGEEMRLFLATDDDTLGGDNND